MERGHSSRSARDEWRPLLTTDDEKLYPFVFMLAATQFNGFSAQREGLS